MAQLPTQYHTLYIEKGTDFSLDIAILDTNRFPDTNLANTTFSAFIRESALSDSPIEIAVSNASIQEGIINLSIPRDMSANLSIYNHLYDLYIIDEHDKKEKILYGILKVYP